MSDPASIDLFIPVPVQVLPEEARCAMAIIQEPFSLPIVLSHAMEERLVLTEFNWQMVAHWVFKLKWSSKHRLPAKRNEAKNWKPFGEMILATLELCIQCYAIKGKELPYDNAYQWWSAIALESKYSELMSATQGKDVLVNKMRKELAMLRYYKNPYNRKEGPHIFELISTATKLAERNTESGVDLDIFRKEYWSPFLGAYKRLVDAFRANHELQVVKQSNDGTLWRQAGRGKGKVNLFPR